MMPAFFHQRTHFILFILAKQKILRQGQGSIWQGIQKPIASVYIIMGHYIIMFGNFILHSAQFLRTRMQASYSELLGNRPGVQNMDGRSFVENELRKYNLSLVRTGLTVSFVFQC